MAVPTPYDAVAGHKLTAVELDAGIRDVLNFLMDPPKCSVAQNTGQTYTNAAYTLQLYDTEVEDSDTMHSTVSNTSRIVFTTAGRFHLDIFTNLVNVPTTYTAYAINLRLNSAGSSVGGTAIRVFDFSTPGGAQTQQQAHLSYVFAAGDYVEVFILQTSGSSRTAASSLGVYANGFQARWVAIN